MCINVCALEGYYSGMRLLNVLNTQMTDVRMMQEHEYLLSDVFQSVGNMFLSSFFFFFSFSGNFHVLSCLFLNQHESV